MASDDLGSETMLAGIMTGTRVGSSIVSGVLAIIMEYIGS